jgi:hypothetical protein
MATLTPLRAAQVVRKYQQRAGAPRPITSANDATQNYHRLPAFPAKISATSSEIKDHPMARPDRIAPAPGVATSAMSELSVADSADSPEDERAPPLQRYSAGVATVPF